MAILPVLTQEDEILRKQCEPITTITPAIRKLAKDMVGTMRAAKGVGLAAPQIGQAIQLIVLESPPAEDDDDNPEFPLQVVVNPSFSAESTKQIEGMEGCLSIPQWYGPVMRYQKIRVSGLNLDGKPYEKVVDGFMSRVFQHEIDHLRGVLFTDYIDDPTKLRKIIPGKEPDEDYLD